MIGEQTGADGFRIDEADACPHHYDQTVQRNQSEQQDDARPDIAGEIPDFSGYDTIILGSPEGNPRAPMIIRTYLDAIDADGPAVQGENATGNATGAEDQVTRWMSVFSRER